MESLKGMAAESSSLRQDEYLVVLSFKQWVGFVSTQTFSGNIFTFP